MFLIKQFVLHALYLASVTKVPQNTNQFTPIESLRRRYRKYKNWQTANHNAKGKRF